MQRLFILLSILIASTAVQAAVVKGTVWNSSENTTEPYATIWAYAGTDTVQPMKTMAADEAGAFTMTLPKGSYRIMATSLGNKPAVKEIKVANNDLDIGRLELVTADNELAAVTVVAQRPVVKREVDRLTYDVQADQDSKSQDLLEFLRKVPMVSVDGEGNIQVKGSSNFKIYKNGRPNKSFSRNAKELFEAIPASTIKRVEVITNPGAREDAEGTSTILNIVTMDNVTTRGVMGSASLFSTSSNNFIPMPNLYLTAQYDRFTISGWGGMWHAVPDNNRSVHDTEGVYQSTGMMRLGHSRSTTRNTGGYGGLESSFDIDSLNLVTADLNLYGYNYRSHFESSEQMFDAAGTPLWQYSTRGYSHNPSGINGLDGSLNYQRMTRLKGESITASWRVAYERSNTDGSTEYYDVSGTTVPYTALNSLQRDKSFENVGQVDWERPFGKKIIMNFGAKYTNRYGHAVSTLDYVGDNTEHQDFKHTTNVAAGYVDWRGTFGKVGLRAGVRYEWSRLAASYPDGKHNDYHSDFNDLCPSLGINWKASESSTFNVSYQKSINRPSISMLDPTVVRTPIEVTSGNPELKTVTNHNISADYSLVKQRVYLQGSLSYTAQPNCFGNTRTVIDNVIYSYASNNQYASEVDLSLYLQWSPFDKTRIQWNVYGGYSHASAPGGLKSNHWNHSQWLQVQQTLPWNLRLSASGSYTTGWNAGLYSYNSISPLCSYSLSLQRSFLKDDRLTVRLIGRNFCGPNKMRIYDHTQNMDYVGTTRSKAFNNASFMVNVSLRFGSLNTAVKKVRTNNAGSDVEKSGNQKPSGLNDQ